MTSSEAKQKQLSVQKVNNQPTSTLCVCVCLCVSVRYERLEDQLNDLTELHQHETSNLKQELASIEEKVAYQAYERARDIQVPVTIKTFKSLL